MTTVEFCQPFSGLPEGSTSKQKRKDSTSSGMFPADKPRESILIQGKGQDDDAIRMKANKFHLDARYSSASTASLSLKTMTTSLGISPVSSGSRSKQELDSGINKRLVGLATQSSDAATPSKPQARLYLDPLTRARESNSFASDPNENIQLTKKIDHHRGNPLGGSESRVLVVCQPEDNYETDDDICIDVFQEASSNNSSHRSHTERAKISKTGGVVGGQRLGMINSLNESESNSLGPDPNSGQKIHANSSENNLSFDEYSETVEYDEDDEDGFCLGSMGRHDENKMSSGLRPVSSLQQMQMGEFSILSNDIKLNPIGSLRRFFKSAGDIVVATVDYGKQATPANRKLRLQGLS